jgi:hypothetical protein
MGLRLFDRAPIKFWEPETVEGDSRTKTSYEDSICHEVKYDPKDKQGEKSILNPSLMVLLSNGSNSWRTSMWSFMAMDSTTMVRHAST